MKKAIKFGVPIAMAAMFLMLSVGAMLETDIMSPLESVNIGGIDINARCVGDGTRSTDYSCGDTVTENYTFTGDMSCSCGHGLIIGADGITIDGNGYTLDGVSPGACDGFGIQRSGIYNPGYDDVVIKNLESKNFCNGIYLKGNKESGDLVYRNTIENCNVHHNGNASGGDTSTHGIKMVFVFNSGVKNCEIHHNTGKGIGCKNGGNGIFLQGGKRNLITHNEIYDNTKGGFFTVMKPEHNTFTYNNIIGNGQGGIILRCKKAANHIIEHNTVTENYGTGVWIGGPSNTIRYNTITNNKNGSAYTGIIGKYGAGIKICRAEADNNEIFSNLVCGNDGVDIEICADIGITGTTGDENTCSTTKNYDDDGTCGCTYSCKQRVDFIKIVDGQYGSCNEIPWLQFVPRGYSITGWAAAYNYTTGYLYDIKVTWSVDNLFGLSQAWTSPLYGTSSTFYAEYHWGVATLKADDGNGHYDTANFAIGIKIP
jgi:parallel beta-helix repeat protein